VATLTGEVEGGEGVRGRPFDHVGDLVHHPLLGQVLAAMLALGQTRHHLDGRGPAGGQGTTRREGEHGISAGRG